VIDARKTAIAPAAESGQDLGFLDEQTMKFTPISPEDSHQRLSSPSRER
jgi:hypothetical protein